MFAAPQTTLKTTPPPCPGPVHGLYPQRSDCAAPWLAATPLHQHLAAWLPVWSGPLADAGCNLPQVRASQTAWADRWASADSHPTPAALQQLRALLGRGGWQQALQQTQALGCAAATMHRVLGRNPYDTQLVCAQLLLQGKLAEMATGEGKTLAVALAAAVAALAGTPVHLMTANDYLVQRDAQLLQPFFAALGLSSGWVCSTSSEAQRRAAYACHITHCTAREVAFDHLRDRQRLQAIPADLQQRAALLGSHDQPVTDGSSTPVPPLVCSPVLRGLCMALVDEADSLLIDEATMPLVLAEAAPDADHRAACVQALALARGLQPGRDVQVHSSTLDVSWTEQALQALAQRCASYGPAWQHAGLRQERVAQALVALHGLQRDTHYLVRNGRVELLDSTTGRSAQGRVWQHGLHNLVELKEGLKPSDPTRTLAQTSYQRFFARYLFVAGTSGTLAECRRELMLVYGLQVLQVPLRTACRRRQLPTQRFDSQTQRNHALVARVRALQATARPVLVGVATVAQAQALSAQLAQAGVLHRVLDARHDSTEADTIAAAGQPGAVTVATAMAGRGTDIALGVGVARAGGLHVLLCQDNRCARLDRQFIGRAGRQGEPGSAEIWLAADAHGLPPMHTSRGPGVGAAGAVDQPLTAAHAPASKASSSTETTTTDAPDWWLAVAHALRQRWHQTRQMQRRRRLLQQELAWQKQLHFTNLHA